MTTSAKWSDLGPRVISGLLLAAVGATLIYFGGLWLLAGLIVIAGLGLWELHRMVGGEAPIRAGIFGALGMFAYGAAQIFAFARGEGFLENLFLTPWIVPLLGLAIWGAIQTVPSQNRWVFASYSALFLFSVAGMFFLWVMHGMIFVMFVVAVVVATDIAGYFAGRILGGPKFWPKVSPKKTWSGTAAGWLAAMLVAHFILPGFNPYMTLLVAPFLALASQLGDIAESAIKRRGGIKDSSNLIPGHGGILDRFDGMAGAMAVATLTMVIAGGSLL